MNQIQSLEIDVESVTQLNHELRMETEKYHQIAVELNEENNSLKNELQECLSTQQNVFQPTGQAVGISVIRHVENARETDSCVGTMTSSGSGIHALSGPRVPLRHKIKIHSGQFFDIKFSLARIVRSVGSQLRIHNFKFVLSSRSNVSIRF